MMKNRYPVTQLIAYIFLILMTICILSPLVLLFISSITDESTLIVNGYSFMPDKLSLEAYSYIFTKGESILRSYRTTILVTIIGTAGNLLLSSMFAFGLSQPNLPGRKFLSFFVFFTMLFNGGLVPSYLMWTGTFHIKNTIWALILPNFLMSAMNVILMRTYFMTSIPGALYESAEIDGASQFTIFRKIVIPLGKPILVTMGVFTGLAYWNDCTNGLYYITDTRKFGIQNYLNKLITDAQFLMQNATMSSSQLMPSMSIKMAIAFIAIIPILIVYPFLQKYFQSGISLGAVKG